MPSRRESGGHSHPNQRVARRVGNAPGDRTRLRQPQIDRAFRARRGKHRRDVAGLRDGDAGGTVSGAGEDADRPSASVNAGRTVCVAAVTSTRALRSGASVPAASTRPRMLPIPVCDGVLSRPADWACPIKVTGPSSKRAAAMFLILIGADRGIRYRRPVYTVCANLRGRPPSLTGIKRGRGGYCRGAASQPLDVEIRLSTCQTGGCRCRRCCRTCDMRCEPWREVQDSPPWRC